MVWKPKESSHPGVNANVRSTLNCPETELFFGRIAPLKAKTLSTVLLFALSSMCQAQAVIKLQTGIGYLEHFSIGATADLNPKNTIGLHYGSNFFYKTGNFSTAFIKYNRLIPLLNYRRITPGIGAKFGYTIFMDSYYKWKIISAVPFFSLRYPLGARLDIGAETGIAISRIESVTRVSYGEIGKYRRYLPEFNISMYYTILNRSRE